MKNTSFKRIWTKTSVKRILKEYSESPVLSTGGFLCFGSPEFRGIWNNPDHKLELQKLAKVFLGPDAGEKNTNDISTTGANVLFSIDYSVRFEISERKNNYDKRKKIRIDFLEHEIKRLSNKK